MRVTADTASSIWFSVGEPVSALPACEIGVKCRVFYGSAALVALKDYFVDIIQIYFAPFFYHSFAFFGIF
jgi:hypothetical protein